jgi:hypothetical protein
VYVNAKTVLVETILAMGEEGIKESGGGDEFKYYYLIHCKNCCKCHNVPHPAKQ